MADVVVTLFEELKSYTPKYPQASIDDALSAVTTAKREGWGAV